ncbi:unnamed protein product [Moneuplotes crassus]|uniref:Uncharacterized protein n=1 Tax=Euplotes crassus TaxID=5936 RepID=A0AAD1XG33_EUPCR|nr:unnamed protein product [Moneuplotes crassus]
MARIHSDSHNLELTRSKDAINEDLEIVKEKNKNKSQVNVSSQKNLIRKYSVFQRPRVIQHKELQIATKRENTGKMMIKRLKNNFKEFNSIILSLNNQNHGNFIPQRKVGNYKKKDSNRSSKARYYGHKNGPERISQTSFFERKNSAQFVKLSPFKKNRRGLKFEIDYGKVKSIVRTYKRDYDLEKFQSPYTRNFKLAKHSDAPSREYKGMHRKTSNPHSVNFLRRQRSSTSNSVDYGKRMSIQGSNHDFFGLKSQTSIQDKNKLLGNSSFDSYRQNKPRENQQKKKCFCFQNSCDYLNRDKGFCPCSAYSSCLAPKSNINDKHSRYEKTQPRYSPSKVNLTFYDQRGDELLIKDKGTVLLKVRKL